MLKDTNAQLKVLVFFLALFGLVLLGFLLGSNSNETTKIISLYPPEKSSYLPEKSYNIEDLGNGWTSFNLGSNKFIIYTDGSQKCITQVK